MAVIADRCPEVQVTVVESIMEAGLSVYQLEVTNVTRGDRGQYQCQVILVSDWSVRWSRDTFLIKLRLYQ